MKLLLSVAPRLKYLVSINSLYNVALEWPAITHVHGFVWYCRLVNSKLDKVFSNLFQPASFSAIYSTVSWYKIVKAVTLEAHFILLMHASTSALWSLGVVQVAYNNVHFQQIFRSRGMGL